MRAIRKRYFARSEGDTALQPFSNASRAAPTARSTSAAVACPTSASGSSVAGEIVAYVCAGSSHAPPTKCPYRSSIVTISCDSGAGAYSKPTVGTSSSVTGEVLRVLIAAGLLLADLHQHVVQERRGAEAEAIGRQPIRAERLVHDHEVLDGLLRGADAARRFHPDDAPRLVVDVPDRLEHAEEHRKRRRRRELAGRRLDEVGAGGHREKRGAAHVVVRPELAGLEDHLQVRPAARLLDAHDLVVDLRVAARQEGAAVDHHVDLVGAVLDHPAHLVELRLERRLA